MRTAPTALRIWGEARRAAWAAAQATRDPAQGGLLQPGTPGGHRYGGKQVRGSASPSTLHPLPPSPWPASPHLIWTVHLRVVAQRGHPWSAPCPAVGVFPTSTCPASSLPRACKGVTSSASVDHLCVPHHPCPGAKACLPASLWVTKGSTVSESSPAKTPGARRPGGQRALRAGPVLGPCRPTLPGSGTRATR